MNDRQERPRDPATEARPSAKSWIMVAIAWTLVGIPLAWAAYRSFLTALKLFQ